MKITWLGHSAFHVEIDGKGIVIDPWVTNPLSPLKSVDEYLEKFKTDIVVITHFHADHVGDAEKILEKTNAKVVAIYEIAEEFAKKGFEVIGANIGGPFEVDGIGFALTPATHSSPIGAPTGVILFKSRLPVLYHAGDTGLFAEMELIGKLYAPKVALLPIGGHFTMDEIQASVAAEMLRSEIVIPMHYDTFPQIKADPEKFARLVAERAPSIQVNILKPGESLEVEL